MPYRPANGDECQSCGMNDTELIPSETTDEPDLFTCYDCGNDQQIWKKVDTKAQAAHEARPTDPPH